MPPPQLKGTCSMNKIEHLIYTERRAGIGMSLDGKTPPKTGYGVYSMSDGLLPEGGFQDRVFLETAINLKNSSRPASSILINSFAYYCPAGGMPMLGYYFQRDGSEDPMDRLSSAYINEWYMGNLNCYPMDLFQAGIWNAHRKPFYWYTKEAPVPTPALETLKAEDLPAVSMREEALRFARNGRADIVRKAVWMILKQMTQPVQNRKYLVIRDSEENVRLWVAAILYQLPVQAALHVSFNTNGFGLNTPQNNCYNFNRKTGTSVKTVAQAGQQNTDFERHYYAMIVGVDPRDATSSSTAATAQVNKPWMIIDGNTLTCFDVPAEELNREYFRCMLDRDEVITNFFMDMAEMVQVEPTMELLDLFDAQLVLQDQSKWNYNALTNALRVMLPHFSNTGHALLLNYVLKHVCKSDGYGLQFAEQDAENRLLLMKQLRQCALIADNSRAIATLQGAAYLHLRNLVRNVDANSKLKSYCTDLDSVQKGLSAALMKNLLEGGLQFLDGVELSAAPDTYVEQIFRLMDTHISNEGSTWSRVWADPLYQSTLDRMAQRVCASDALTEQVLRILEGNKPAMERLILAGSSGENTPAKARWLCKLISRSVTLDYLLALLSRNGAEPELMEMVLCGRIKQNGCTPEIREAYNRYLSMNPNTAVKFYEAWYEDITGSDQNPQYFARLDELLTDMAARASASKYIAQILKKLDSQVEFEPSEYSKRLVKLLLTWSERCSVEVKNAELWLFLGNVLNNNRQYRGLPMYKRCICENLGCVSYPAPKGFAASSMCQKFLDAALKDGQEPAMQAIVMLFFEFESNAEQAQYFDSWVKRVCDTSTKYDDFSLAAFFGVYYVVTHGSGKLSKDCEQVLDNVNLRTAEAAFSTAMSRAERYLGKIRTEKVSAAIVEDVRQQYGKEAAKELASVFERAQRTYRSEHKGLFDSIGSKFSGLFGSKKGDE